MPAPFKADMRSDTSFGGNEHVARHNDAHARIIALENGRAFANIKDYGSDDGAGAVGDGVVRKVSAATVTNKAALGFSGSDRMDDVDAEDTEDWLSIVLAVKDLTSKGGGVLYIPRPSVKYPIRRFIPLPAGVPIHVMGDGYNPNRTDIDNVCDLTVGWQEGVRRVVFQPRTWKHNGLVAGDANSATIVDVAAVAIGYTAVIPLVAGGGGTFAAGNRVVVYTRASYEVGIGNPVPNKANLRRVVSVSGDELLLDEPISFYAAANDGRVAKMGTGIDGSLGGAPFDFVDNLHISGLNCRGSGLLAYGWAGRNCLIEDVGITAETAVSNALNSAVSINGVVDSTLRRLHIRTKNRGLEVKGISGQRWRYQPDEERGGTGLLIQDVGIRMIGTAAADAPPVTVGESTSAKFERISVVGSASSHATFMKIDDCEVCIVRGFEAEVRSTAGTSQMFQVVGHKQPVGRSLIDIAGSRQGGTSGGWLRSLVCTDPGDGRPRPNIKFDGLRIGTSVAGSPKNIFAVPFLGYGAFSDFVSELGETLQFSGTSTVPSLIPDILGATSAQIAAAADWINTGYKRRGLPVYDTTNNRLLHPIGRTATSAWRPYSGDPDVVPA